MMAVAKAENGYVECEDVAVKAGDVFFIDRGGSAGKNDAARAFQFA